LISKEIIIITSFLEIAILVYGIFKVRLLFKALSALNNKVFMFEKHRNTHKVFVVQEAGALWNINHNMHSQNLFVVAFTERQEVIPNSEYNLHVIHENSIVLGFYDRQDHNGFVAIDYDTYGKLIPDWYTRELFRNINWITPKNISKYTFDAELCQKVLTFQPQEN